MIRSLKLVHGVDVEWTSDIPDTIALLLELRDYFNREKHLSLFSRPALDSDWPVPTNQEKYLYWLQGLPSVKVSRARLLIQHFPTPEALFQATREQMLGVPGLGKALVGQIWGFLHQGRIEIKFSPLENPQGDGFKGKGA